MKKAIVMLLGLSAFVLYASPLFAEEKMSKKPWHRWNFNLGAAHNLNDSQVQLGVKGVGVEIDAEELLNLETSTTTFRLDANWRFTRNMKHRLDFTWYSNHRSGDTTIGQPIDIGDTVIDAGTYVKTTFDLDIIRLGYSYSFFQDDRMDIAVGGGLYVMPIDFTLETSGLITEYVSERFAAPLPVVSVRADFAITPKWFIRNRIDAFYLKYDNYKGAIVDTRVALEWEAFKHIGFGLAWDNFRLKAEGEGASDIPGAEFNGTFKFQNSGVMLYLKGYF